MRKSNLHTKHDKKPLSWWARHSTSVEELHNVHKAPFGLCYSVLAQIRHSNRTDWLQAQIIAPYVPRELLKVPPAMWGTHQFFGVFFPQKGRKTMLVPQKFLAGTFLTPCVRVKTLPTWQEPCDIFLAAGCLSKLWTHQGFGALLVLASMLWLTSKLGKKRQID